MDGEIKITGRSEAQRERARWYNIKYKFGIHQAEYEELLERQEFRCFICQRHKDEFTKELAVDHDHHTGEVRGLLCQHCNQQVLGRHRDPVLFERAALYLRLPPTGWFVPKRKPRKKKRKKKNV